MNETEKRYDAGKCECCGLMKGLPKIRNYVYGVRFLIDPDGNTFAHQLYLPTNEVPGAVVTRWMAWI